MLMSFPSCKKIRFPGTVPEKRRWSSSTTWQWFATWIHFSVWSNEFAVVDLVKWSIFWYLLYIFKYTHTHRNGMSIKGVLHISMFGKSVGFMACPTRYMFVFNAVLFAVCHVLFVQVGCSQICVFSSYVLSRSPPKYHVPWKNLLGKRLDFKVFGKSAILETPKLPFIPDKAANYV